jgi:hypothetical protein
VKWEAVIRVEATDPKALKEEWDRKGPLFHLDKAAWRESVVRIYFLIQMARNHPKRWLA